MKFDDDANTSTHISATPVHNAQTKQHAPPKVAPSLSPMGSSHPSILWSHLWWCGCCFRTVENKSKNRNWAPFQRTELNMQRMGRSIKIDIGTHRIKEVYNTNTVGTTWYSGPAVPSPLQSQKPMDYMVSNFQEWTRKQIKYTLQTCVQTQGHI